MAPPPNIVDMDPDNYDDDALVAKVTSDVHDDPVEPDNEHQVNDIVEDIDVDVDLGPEASKKNGKAEAYGSHARKTARLSGDDEVIDSHLTDLGLGTSVPLSSKSKKPTVVHLQDEEDDDDAAEADADVVKASGRSKSASKKRGQPSKVPEALADEAEEPPKKKRGRPAANVNDEDDNEDTAKHSPRGRGRLPKSAKSAKTATPRASLRDAATFDNSPVKQKSAHAKASKVATTPSGRPSRAAAELALEQISEQKKPQYRAIEASAPITTRNIATPSTAGGEKATATMSAATKEYVVEHILDMKTNTKKKDGSDLYFVKWKGYEHKDNTWEPFENLTHCRDKLAKFLRSRKA